MSHEKRTKRERLWRSCKRAGLAALTPLYIRRLRASAAKAASADDVVQLVFDTKLFSLHIAPLQRPGEVRWLFEKVRGLAPNRVMEIGTAKGGTLFLWAQAAGARAELISIDLESGPFGGGYPRWKMPLFHSFARDKQVIHLLRADSHDPATERRVRKLLGNDNLDFLFIDGDHTYEGVAEDFRMYGPLVRPGGIIAFHDIVPGSAERAGGVARFWSEIKSRYTVEEMVEDSSSDGYGVGILFQP